MLLINIDRGRAEGAALAKALQELERAREAHEVGDNDDNLSQEVSDDLRVSFSYQRS